MAYQLAKKHKLKTAWGTDTLSTPSWPPAGAREDETLVQEPRNPEDGDGTNAELLAMSGPRNPCPGNVGVLVDRDPQTNMDLVSDPDRNFMIIMKDGGFIRMHSGGG